MKTIYLVRHCKAAGQEPEAALTEEGKAQARKLADFVQDHHIEAILSSPYTRAMESIRPLSKRIDIDIEIEVRLKERVLTSIDREDWMEQLQKTYSDLHLKFEDGESSHEAMARGIEVINELLQRPEEVFIVVTHGALMSLILKYFDHTFGFDQWRSLSNPDIFKLQFNHQGKPVIERIWK